MKVLRLNAYYLPEKTASSHMFEDLNTAFEENKIEYTIITPMPTRGVDDIVRKRYQGVRVEKTNGGYVQVKRFNLYKEGRNPFLRALRYLLMNTIEYHKAVKEDNVDLVFSSSTPPTQGMLSAIVAKKLSKKYRKKVPFIFNLQDVFPDSLVNAGMTSKGSLLWKIGRKIEDFTYKNADKIIVISNGFKRNIMEKGVPEEKIEVISNWIDLKSVHSVERKENRLISEFCLDPNKFIVVYAGNFGAAQGADIVLKAARELVGEKDIQFAIFGGGSYFEDVRKEAEGLENVFIHELMPQERISEVYSLGDVALITCKAGTGKAGMPSKTWSIMACNTPIIASFDTDSDLADVIRDSGAGKCVDPEDVEALCKAIKKRKENTVLAYNSREYVKQNASKESCVNKYIQVLIEQYNRLE